MIKILAYIQIAFAFLLMLLILLQQRGTGVGVTFGGGGALRTERRGAEKYLFYATIVLSIIFIGLAIASLILGNQTTTAN